MTTPVSKAADQQQQHQSPEQRQRREQQQKKQRDNEELEARTSELFPDLPDVLEFESWWNERPKIGGGSAAAGAVGGRTSSTGRAAAAISSSGISSNFFGDSGSEPSKQIPTRRFMLIRYFSETGQVEVQTDDAVVPLTIVVTTRSGAPLRPWDVYVGASIDILGRSTTLHAASFKTMHWLDDNCRRLWRLKEKMEQRLNRFVSVPRISLDYGPYKQLVQPSSGTKVQLGGKACPGVIARRILEIQDQLSQYQ
jgi:hypothetical protein